MRLLFALYLEQTDQRLVIPSLDLSHDFQARDILCRSPGAWFPFGFAGCLELVCDAMAPDADKGENKVFAFPVCLLGTAGKGSREGQEGRSVRGFNYWSEDVLVSGGWLGREGVVRQDC